MRVSNPPFESAYAVHLDDETARLKGALLKDIQRSAYVYRIDCGGCNGCEIEIFASITPVFDAERFGIKVVSSPRHADILVYTGAVTRSMRVPALRAYHAAPEPKIVVAYGACGSSGGIFHNAYGVWGGADQIVPVDLYIPGCPPTPPATIYGFAVALGLLKQKLHAETHVQAPDVHAHPAFPDVPPALRVAVDRSARRLAGYWHGRKIADAFLTLYQPNDPAGTAQAVEDYIQKQDDPRVVEIMRCLKEEL